MFTMFPSFQHRKYCFQCQFMFSRCKLCLGYTTKIRASKHLQNFCELEQAGAHLIFASNSSKGQILQALSNWMGPFDSPKCASYCRGFIKGRVLDKLTGCEWDLVINLPGCFHLLFLLSFLRKTRNACLKNPTDLLHKNFMKPLLLCSFVNVQMIIWSEFPHLDCMCRNDTTSTGIICGMLNVFAISGKEAWSV